MKILHTSDWHLGKRLDDFSRLEEQQAVMEEICEIAEREETDVVLVSGDLFDTFNPPTEAIDLLYKTLKRLTANGHRPVIAIAGNHDSPDRIEAPDPLARECGIIFAGYPNSVVMPFILESGLKVLQSDEGFLELQLPGTSVPLRVLFTPYANEYRLKTFLGHEESEDELRNMLQERWQSLADRYCDSRGVNILVTHLFMVKKGDPLPEEPEEEKPILMWGVRRPFSPKIFLTGFNIRHWDTCTGCTLLKSIRRRYVTVAVPSPTALPKPISRSIFCWWRLNQERQHPSMKYR